MDAPFDKLLVLDLDETLVHCRCDWYGGEGPEREADHHICGSFQMYERPGVRDFLTWCFENFRDVGVWTAGTLPYAQEVLPILCDMNKFSFVWGRERCGSRRDMETHETHWVKDIAKLRKRGYSKHKILCVDDTPQNFYRSYGNFVHMPAYYGDPGDDMLPRLAEYLEELGPLSNVRSVDKRGWPTRAL